MNENKVVPNIRFKGFEDEWRSCDLGKIAKLYQPKTITQKQMTSEGFPVFGANGFIGFYGKKNHSTDQVTISARGENAGVTSYVLAPVWITGNSMVINVDKNKDIDKHFLFFYLSLINLKKFVTGGAQPQLTVETLRKVKIIVTKIKEQQKIGNFFAKLDKLLDLQQQKIDKLELLKKALLQKLFPKSDSKTPELRFKGFENEWENDSIKNVSTMKSGGTPSVNKREYYVGDIPFIRSSDIKKKTTELKINGEALKNSSSFMVEKGTVLYALYGATSGQVAISKVTGAINQAVLAIFPDEFVNKYFLLYWLSFNKEKITNKYLQGGQGNLSAKIVKNLLLFFPTKPEQQKIGNLLSKVDQLIELENKKLQDFQQVKKCLLQNMFVE